jgi:hypothetical protein
MPLVLKLTKIGSTRINKNKISYLSYNWLNMVKLGLNKLFRLSLIRLN